MTERADQSESQTPKSVRADAPGRLPTAPTGSSTDRHRGVLMTGSDGVDGPKAFYIHVEARPGRTEQVRRMLGDIFAAVQDEPATGPWFAVQYSETVFAIFEAFPDLAGRQAHVEGLGGEIFRDLERMNDILVQPAHVAKVDILMSKQVFA